MFDQKMVIPSIRNLKDLEKALYSGSEYLLLSEVHIGNLQDLTKKCHQLNKKVLVHLDLIEGLAKDAKGVKWLKEMYKVDGVISPNIRILNSAKKMGLICIYRVFLLDSRSLDQALTSLKHLDLDGVEVLPGIFAINFIEEFLNVNTKIPLLAGGFLNTQQKIDCVFEAGFNAVTTSNKELW